MNIAQSIIGDAPSPAVDAPPAAARQSQRRAHTRSWRSKPTVIAGGTLRERFIDSLWTGLRKRIYQRIPAERLLRQLSGRLKETVLASHGPG